MDLQAVGIISQIASAMGVVASVIYLATQIRQAQKVARAENVREVQAGFEQHFGTLANDAEMLRIYRTGLLSPSQLDCDERVRFEYIMFRFLRSFIDCHAAHRDGVFPTDIYEAWRYAVASALQTPGGTEHWMAYREFFVESFQLDWAKALESLRDKVALPHEFREQPNAKIGGE